MTDDPKMPYDLFGVECGPGWRKIIEPLMAYCAEHDISILQIKEKFGGLRFYYGAYESAQRGVIDTLEDMLAAAEREAEQTCETCGKPGVLRTDGWMQTLCDEHGGDRETGEGPQSLRISIRVPVEDKK